MTIEITTCQARVLLQGLEAVGWDALPKQHADRIAATQVREKIKAALLDAAERTDKV